MKCTVLTHLLWHAAALASLYSAAAFAVSPPQTPIEPRYELVNVLGSNDVAADIAVDPSSGSGGRPAILYYDTTTAEGSVPKPIPLKLARFDRFAWVSGTQGLVNRRDLTAHDARDVRLSIDATGKAHALVIESNDAGVADDALVYFSTNAQGAPLREQIDVGSVSQIALTIQHFGEPFVAYIKNQGAGGGTLVVRYRAGGTWATVPQTAPPANAYSPTLAPLPAQANFLSVRLAWVENATNSSILRHAFVLADAVTTTTVASNSIRFSLSTPQIVVDAAGTAEVAYVSSVNPAAPTVELRRRLFNEESWNCIDTGCALPTGTLAAGFALSPHGYVQDALNYHDGTFSRLLRRDGAGWVSHQLANVANAQGAARDALGNVYATGIDRSTHRDLFAVRVGGPWQSRGRIPFDSNTLLSHPLDVTSEGNGRPVIYARRSCCTGDPRGSLWLIDSGTDFIEMPLPGSFTAAAASVAYSSVSGIHIAIYDSDQRDLIHARYAPTPGGSDWTITRVDTVGDVGLSPTMLLGPGDTPMIVYRRRPDLLHVAAQGADGTWAIRTLSTGVLDQANPVAVVSREGFIVHASWFDEVAGRLRVSTRYGSLLEQGVTSTDTVPTPEVVVSGRVHDIAILGDGQLGAAFSEQFNGQSQMEYLYRSSLNQWNSSGSEPQPFGPDGITRISLDTTLLAPGGARVAWIAGGKLLYAEKSVGLIAWRSEDLGSIAATAPMQLGAAGPLRITYNQSDGLFMLERAEALADGSNGSITQLFDPVGGAGYAYCICFLHFPNTDETGSCFGDPQPESNAAPGAPSRTSGSSPSGKISGSLSTPGVLAGMRELFSTTPAGRYYLQLFAEHAPEIIRLTLTDPSLLVQRTRTLSDLIPGMTALVASPAQGELYRLKPELIGNARAVWQGWATAGSPALAAAVNNELARTNNLNQFTGMTFTQWFNAISVGNATESVFADGFE